MIFYGKGSSSINFSAKVTKAINRKELAKKSVTALNEAGEEIAMKMATYVKQKAPIYTGALYSTIRVREYNISNKEKSWAVVSGGMTGYGINPRRQARRDAGIKQRNRGGIASTGTVRKFVDYAEYINEHGSSKGRGKGFMSNALNKHKQEYHNIFVRKVKGSLSFGQRKLRAL